MLAFLRLSAAALPFLLSTVLFAQTAAPPPRSLVIVGDTIAGASTGQQSPLQPFFDSAKLAIIDRSTSNHSTRSFVTSGDWAAALALVKPNDVVLIQFGAHENGPQTEAPAPGTTGLSGGASLPGLSDDFREVLNPATQKPELVHTFGWYLREMVVETIARGGIPVLCSPAAPSASTAQPGADPNAYSGWVRAIADQQRVPYLDITHAATSSEQPAVVAALKSLTPDPLAGFFSQQGTAVPAAPPLPPAPALPAVSLQSAQ